MIWYHHLTKATKFLLKAVFKQQQQKWTTEQKKRIYEIDANTIERWGEITASSGSLNYGGEDIVKFESDDMSNELINEDEIPF